MANPLVDPGTLPTHQRSCDYTWGDRGLPRTACSRQGKPRSTLPRPLTCFAHGVRRAEARVQRPRSLYPLPEGMLDEFMSGHDRD